MRILAIAVAAAVLTGCDGLNGTLVSPGHHSSGRHHRHSSGLIQHVVIIIQENRTLNNLFMSYPGATTATYGLGTTGQQIPLQPVTLATTWDLEHSAAGFIASCNGTGKVRGANCQMNGFDRETWTCSPTATPCPNSDPPYSYVPQSEAQPYWTMANQYVLGDEMFASDFDTSSFIAHQYLIAGEDPNSAFNFPTGLWGCAGGASDVIHILGPNRKTVGAPTEQACWDPTTLADELDSAGLTWAYYATAVPIGTKGGTVCNATGAAVRDRVLRGVAGLWSAYQAINHICYGPDWNNIITPPSQFLTDVAAGSLRNVTWITPTHTNSDESGAGSNTGPSWVASLVNAIGESQFWNTTAIFVLWDDSGGWYDPAAPQYLDNDGLGFRVPLLIISPYAKQGYVSHVPYEFGSVLQFTEDQFGLARLAASDTRANSPETDAFNFTQQPSIFIPISAPYTRAFFLHQRADPRPPDAQ